MDIAGTLQGLAQVRDDQIPFAVSLALNRTIEQARVETVREMERVFDRPTPYARNGLRVRRATKANLEAEIAFKDEAGKGIPADKFMAPEVFGGRRRLKRSEIALQRIGAMPAGYVTVVGSGAKLDAYGNISRGQIVQILSYLQAFGEQGYRANSTPTSRARLGKTTKKKSGIAYFALTYPKNGLQPGVYIREHSTRSRSVKPVLLYVREANYRRRLPMSEIIERTLQQRFGDELAAAMGRAIATAKPMPAAGAAVA